MDPFWWWYNCDPGWFQPQWWKKDHCGWAAGGFGGWF